MIDPFVFGMGVWTGLFIWFLAEWFFRGPPVRVVSRPRMWVKP